ncbi:MAG: FKBP-type peptidyl-prolyl cis-trans isomerase [Bacteroidales bacterium]|nr:FKBP-type peptidyl-prolyl cis-trans isomerase [Bacteroidales bacterium]
MLFLLGLLVSCSNPDEPQKARPSEAQLKEPLLKANEHLAASEEDRISDFISRYGWNMKVTGSGLRYQVYEAGSGAYPKTGQVVNLDYELRLINGQVIYSSERNGALLFRQGKAEVPRGLDEAVLLLRQGDRAKIIIPSHLGYGLLGDQDLIPPKATLIYDLHLKSIEP